MEDPITSAIVAALSSGKVDSAVEPGQREIFTAYQTLKKAVRQRFGADSELFEAVSQLEKKPESQGRKEVLQEEVAVSRAVEDPVLLAAAEILLEQIKAQTTKTELVPPLQRPLRPKRFLGRERELAQLLPRLRPGQVVALSGAEGIGKSALAAEAVWKLAPAETPPQIFPDGIIYHDFYNQPRVDVVLEQIARTFGEKPIPGPYDAAERALAERQALLVLDSVELADDLPGILAVRGRCGVLVTSYQSQATIADSQQLSSLPLDQAVTLLQGWGGAQAADPITARQICELVGGSPLAIYLVGHYLAKRREKGAGYLAWLTQTPLSTMKYEQRQTESIPLLLEHSLAQVSDIARQALAVVALLALAPFNYEVVVETLMIEINQGLMTAIRRIFKQRSEEKMPDVGPALDELVDYGLLWRVGQRYQICHALIHAYSQQHLVMPAKALRRLATWYMALAWEQTALGPAGYARLDADRLHFMKVLTKCIEMEDWEAAYGLATAIEDYLDRRDYWAERVITNEIGLIAAWQLGRPSEGAWLGNLGDTYRTMGHAKWAIEHFEKALATARQNGDRHSEGNSLGNLGLAYRDLGQIERARSYLEQSLSIFERINSPSANLVRDWLKELKRS